MGWKREHLLWVCLNAIYALADTPGFASFRQPLLPPPSPCILIFKARMFRATAIVQGICQRFRKRFIGCRVADRFRRGGNRGGDCG
jgi:hypothetical protein